MPEATRHLRVVRDDGAAQEHTNPAWMAIAAKGTPSSRRQCETMLRAAARQIWGPFEDHIDPIDAAPWASLDFETVQSHQSELVALGRKTNTVNTRISGLKVVGRFAWKLCQIDAERLERIRSVERVRGQTEAGRYVEGWELATLLRDCRHDGPGGLLEAAALAFYFAAGMRRNEATGLLVTDYDPETGEVFIRQGKGRKDRRAGVAPSGRGHVARWLEARAAGLEAVAKAAEDPAEAARLRAFAADGSLLCPVRRTGVLLARAITGESIARRVRERQRALGMRHFVLHDGRRTFITAMNRVGRMKEAQLLCGHADLSTTARYDRRGLDEALATLGDIEFPSLDEEE